MTRAELLKEIERIPGDNGWWHSDGHETFQALAEELVDDAGMDHDKALSVLERAYSAAAGEFGS